MKEKKEYSVQVDAYGRAWMLAALAVMLLVPISMCIYFGVWPNVLDVLAGLQATILHLPQGAVSLSE